jgi:hypothetical protein
VSEPYLLLLVNTVYLSKVFGYNSKAGGSDFCVFLPNCLIKIGEIASNELRGKKKKKIKAQITITMTETHKKNNQKKKMGTCGYSISTRS